MHRVLISVYISFCSNELIILHGIHRFTETTTVDYHGGINEHMLTPISSTFYTVTLNVYDDWIPTPIKLKMLLKRINCASIKTLCSIGGFKGGKGAMPSNSTPTCQKVVPYSVHIANNNVNVYCIYDHSSWGGVSTTSELLIGFVKKLKYLQIYDRHL